MHQDCSQPTVASVFLYWSEVRDFPAAAEPFQETAAASAGERQELWAHHVEDGEAEPGMRSSVRAVAVVLDGEGNLRASSEVKATYAYGVENGRNSESAGLPDVVGRQAVGVGSWRRKARLPWARWVDYSLQAANQRKNMRIHERLNTTPFPRRAYFRSNTYSLRFSFQDYISISKLDSSFILASSSSFCFSNLPVRWRSSALSLSYMRSLDISSSWYCISLFLLDSSSIYWFFSKRLFLSISLTFKASAASVGLPWGMDRDCISSLFRSILVVVADSDSWWLTAFNYSYNRTTCFFSYYMRAREAWFQRSRCSYSITVCFNLRICVQYQSFSRALPQFSLALMDLSLSWRDFRSRLKFSSCLYFCCFTYYSSRMTAAKVRLADMHFQHYIGLLFFVDYTTASPKEMFSYGNSTGFPPMPQTSLFISKESFDFY